MTSSSSRIRYALLAVVAGVAAVTFAPVLVKKTESQSGVRLQDIKLPPGFRISLYAEGVANARQMTLSPAGTLYVGSQRAGTVYAIPDRNKDGKGDEVITIAKGLNTPNGVAFRDDALYVAEVSRVLRFDNIESNFNAARTPTVVNSSFPSDWMHGWKFIAFGPDGMLYVPVGAPCNICERDPDQYYGLFRMKPDGTGRETFAHGVRNTVGFDWHPQTRELWFTENGRDLLGDDVPADELNRAPTKGLHFGYPYCHQGDIADPNFGAKRPCSEFVPPAAKIDPHTGSVGMRFYTGTSFPAHYRNQIFIAQHGSWNRTPQAGHIGYRILVAYLDANGEQVTKIETFAEGWEKNPRGWGRPSDVQVMRDGALLVSDDSAGVIYRIAYGK